jgi:uncharacterized protein (TIGR00266 family)
MEHIIAHAPTFTTLEFRFQEGESVAVQPGSMIAMTTGFDLKAGAGTHMQGKPGVGRALRSTLAGENFFTAVYTAKRPGERLILGPGEMGEIRRLDVSGEQQHIISSGSFLACTNEIRFSLQYAGVKGWMATRGLFLMRTEGVGQVFVSSFGAVAEQQLAEGERFVLDNRYIVAFSTTMKYEIVKVAKSIRHSLLSGEGVVNRFTGPGTLLYQTRARPGRGFLRGIMDFAT